MSVLASLSPVAWFQLWLDPPLWHGACCGLTLVVWPSCKNLDWTIPKTHPTPISRLKTIIYSDVYPHTNPWLVRRWHAKFHSDQSNSLVKGFLVSVDTHMNLQLDNMEESMKSGTSGQLSKTLIRQIIPTKSFLIGPEPPWLQNPKTVLILNHGCLRFPEFFPTKLLQSYNLFQVQQKMLEFNPDYSALNRIIWKII